MNLLLCFTGLVLSFILTKTSRGEINRISCIKGSYIMPNWLKTAGKWGAIAAILTAFVSIGALLVYPDLSLEMYSQSSGLWGTIFAILTLIITLLKQIIAFIGFLTTAIKILVIVVFVAVILGVGLLAFRAMQVRRKPSE